MNAWNAQSKLRLQSPRTLISLICCLLLVVAGGGILLISTTMSKQRLPTKYISNESYFAVLKHFVASHSVKKVEITEYRETSSRFRCVARIKAKLRGWLPDKNSREFRYVYYVADTRLVICVSEQRERVFNLEIYADKETEDLRSWLVERFQRVNSQLPIAVRQLEELSDPFGD